jgi:hypothetical protein
MAAQPLRTPADTMMDAIRTLLLLERRDELIEALAAPLTSQELLAIVSELEQIYISLSTDAE